MDNQAAYYNSAALLMAILHRAATGEGCEIDVSAVEAGVTLLGPDLFDVTVNGRATRRADFPRGNRLEHPQAAPHGVYPCRDTDRWVAIAVFGDDEWARLVAAIGEPAWTADPRFATQSDRFANHDALDELIGAWTRERTPHEAMQILQAAGVAAAAVQNPRDLTDEDPQIAYRGTFFELDHPVIGPALFEGSPMRLSRTDADLWRSAPLLGEDNDYVFGEILGLDEQRRLRSRRSGGDLDEHAVAGVRDPAGRRARRRPGGRVRRQAAGRPRRGRRQDRATGRCRRARRRPVRGRPGRRPGREPELLDLQHEQAQRRARRFARAAARTRRADRHRRRPADDVDTVAACGPRHRPRRVARRPARVDRAVRDAVRADRAVGGVPLVRPRCAGRRRPAQPLRLRRPLDPADPPGRQPGVHGRGKLRALRRAARADRAAPHRTRTARGRLDARGHRRQRRARESVLVLSESLGAAADRAPCAAGADPACDLPVRGRRVDLSARSCSPTPRHGRCSSPG